MRRRIQWKLSTALFFLALTVSLVVVSANGSVTRAAAVAETPAATQAATHHNAKLKSYYSKALPSSMRDITKRLSNCISRR